MHVSLYGLRFAPKVPEHGAEKKRCDGSEDDPDGVVKGVPLVGQVLFPQAGHALREWRLRVHHLL